VSRTFETPEANEETGKRLRKFFTDLLDDTNLRMYHENPEGWVKSQQETGILNDDAAQLILSGSLREIEANIKLVSGSGHAVPVCIVFPPF
jgi:hypothetical protein